MRSGRIARGGLRWSDRREDFRTEILGLMKAQNVKNTMIVPVGAKGGFVAKRLPASGERGAEGHVVEQARAPRRLVRAQEQLERPLVAAALEVGRAQAVGDVGAGLLIGVGGGEVDLVKGRRLVEGAGEIIGLIE